MMIRTLKGTLTGKAGTMAVVEVNGIGYAVFMAIDTLDKLAIEQEVFLHIYHHIAEARQELYGFIDTEARSFFELLISVSGVGPKMALSILSAHNVSVLRAAVSQGDAAVFTSASGVGRKIAERIIVDLKSKVGIQPDVSSHYGAVYEALSSLGYKPAEIKEALTGIGADESNTQEQIRQALKHLAKK